MKGRHRLSPAMVAEYELIEVRLELGTADAMMGTNQPVLEVTDDAIGERHDKGRSLRNDDRSGCFSAMWRYPAAFRPPNARDRRCRPSNRRRRSP